MHADGRLRSILAAALLAALVATGLALHLRSTVRRALEGTPRNVRPIDFAALPIPAEALDHWGTGEVLGVAATPTGLLTAGGAGVFEDDRPLDGLPTLRAAALALWRGQPVVALAAGGLYRRADGRWNEARTGWGVLHARTLCETPSGELLIGAREGLYRAVWGLATLERLDPHPVRGLAPGSGFILAGGEDGLYRVEPGRTARIETPDSWVESVAVTEGGVFAVTAAGLAKGPLAGPLEAVAGGEDVIAGVVHDGGFYGIDGRAAAVSRRDVTTGRIAEEVLPATPRRVLSTRGGLLADTAAGLCRRDAGRWILLPRRTPVLPASGHVGALAWLSGHLVVGLFDGGLAVAEPKAGGLDWREVEGASAWGVNALLPAGGVLYVASLRGAARFDGTRLTPLDGPGAAFSLAATPDGVAIGYGQGLLLPGPRLLSAFHGLPGNQALALAVGGELFVGTPSGLGAVEGRRVRWRVGAGEGRLPHPWVTALALSRGALYVGTYGGGLVRRTATPAGDAGRFEPFVETEGLKISSGALVEAAGRIWAGTDGGGLYRSSPDRSRFEHVAIALPSPHVTALAATSNALYVGTDEGLARVPLSPPASTQERTE
jgi:hypothetical protein